PSFLTSRLPSQIRGTNPADPYAPFAEEERTLFQALHDAGFHTVGVFSHFYFGNRRGLDRGFDDWSNDGMLQFHDANFDSASPRIVPRVVKKLESLKGRHFALWTHLFEP